jgi:hypothetical protein
MVGSLQAVMCELGRKIHPLVETAMDLPSRHNDTVQQMADAGLLNLGSTS